MLIVFSKAALRNLHLTPLQTITNSAELFSMKLYQVNYHYTACIERSRAVKYFKWIAFSEKIFSTSFVVSKEILWCNSRLTFWSSLSSMGRKLIFFVKQRHFLFGLIFLIKICVWNTEVEIQI